MRMAGARVLLPYGRAVKVSPCLSQLDAGQVAN